MTVGTRGCAWISSRSAPGWQSDGPAACAGGAELATELIGVADTGEAAGAQPPKRAVAHLGLLHRRGAIAEQLWPACAHALPFSAGGLLGVQRCHLDVNAIRRGLGFAAWRRGGGDWRWPHSRRCLHDL